MVVRLGKIFAPAYIFWPKALLGPGFFLPLPWGIC